MENRVRALRKKSQMSQRALASAAETSQQQIQRIEVGGQAASLDLATRIAKALGVPIEEAFPAAKAKGKSSRKKAKQGPLDAGDTGFETDTDSWFLIAILKGGVRHELPLSSQDKSRLATLLHGARETQFFVFDSGAHHVVLNLKHARSLQLLWEPNPRLQEFATADFDEQDITVFWENVVEKDTFDAEPDWAEEDGDIGRLAYLMAVADGWGEMDDAFLPFMDGDGEMVHLNGDQVALLAIPMWLTDHEFETEEAEPADSPEAKEKPAS